VNDDELITSLGVAIAPDDDLLADVIRQGIGCFCWRGIDYELAHLLEEPEETAVLMRSSDAGRHFVFVHADSTVDLAVLPKDDHCSLVGWIDPVQELEVRVLGSAGEELGSAPVDAQGRFRLVVDYVGPVRLEFSHRPVILTDWFSTR
jgi:hypothetical protein